MFLMRRWIMFLFAVLATSTYGEAQMVGYYPKGGADIAAEDVSLIQLIANPRDYDGKTIRIIGFFTWSSKETSSICMTKTFAMV